MAWRMAASGLLLALLGCETTRPDPPPLTPESVKLRWLPGIEDGKTTRQSATAALGAPHSFCGGRVAVWRLFLVLDRAPLDDAALDAELDEIAYIWMNPYHRYQPVNLPVLEERREELFITGALVCAGADPPPSADRHALVREAEFHLVAVFGSDGLLRRHSMVRVGP